MPNFITKVKELFLDMYLSEKVQLVLILLVIVECKVEILAYFSIQLLYLGVDI